MTTGHIVGLILFGLVVLIYAGRGVATWWAASKLRPHLSGATSRSRDYDRGYVQGMAVTWDTVAWVWHQATGDTIPPPELTPAAFRLRVKALQGRVIHPRAAVETVRKLLMTRAGDTIDEVVAVERARNIVQALLGCRIGE